jgi:hypothetical protein
MRIAPSSFSRPMAGFLVGWRTVFQTPLRFPYARLVVMRIGHTLVRSVKLLHSGPGVSDTILSPESVDLKVVNSNFRDTVFVARASPR